MKLAHFCIKRPVFSWVLSLILIVLGLVSFYALNIRFMPNFQSPVLRIETTYPGASAKLVESKITTRIESEIAGIPGISSLQSTSGAGYSYIKVRLLQNVSIDHISAEIRDRISQIINQLPTNISTPRVVTGHSGQELMDIIIQDSHKSPHSIRDYVDRFMLDQLNQVPGVSNIWVVGASPYAMRISLSPLKLKAYNLSPMQVATAIQKSNTSLPIGKFLTHNINYPITTNTELKTATAYNDVPILNIGTKTIRVKNVGHAYLGSDTTTTRSYASWNGKPALDLAIDTSMTTNPLQVSHSILKRLAQLKQHLPSGMKVTIAYNKANYMHSSITEVYRSIWVAICCVIFIITLFLGSFRSALVPIITIPICLLGGFLIIRLFGFTLNLITLLAIVLSIGLVVDDAIVMLENIYRHIEHGLSPLAAALKGSKEIGFAVIAMTLTLVAVYAPIGLIHSATAIIFKSFAFTLAGTVLISGFVALTLSPMMCSKILSTHSHTRFKQSVSAILNVIERNYTTLLSYILNYKRWILVLLAAIAVGGTLLFHQFPHEFIPAEDIGLIGSFSNSPSGSSLAYNVTQGDRFGKLIHIGKNIQGVLSISGEGQNAWTYTALILKPYHMRTQTSASIAKQLEQRTQKHAGLNFTVFPSSYYGGSSNHAQLSFSLMTSGSNQALYNTSTSLINSLKKYPGTSHVSSSFQTNSQQYKITINRRLAAALHVSTKTIDQTLSDFLSGQKISSFNIGGTLYNVLMQAKHSILTSPSTLSRLYVKNSSAALIPLSVLLHITPISTSTLFSHFNRLPATTINVDLTPGYSFGEMMHYLTHALPALLPANSTYAFLGKARYLLQTQHSMLVIFSLAIIFIYLVLAAQFESFIDPLIILIAVPLSIIGALIALKLAHGSLNIYTDIGLVTLIGLISKHGILITQFANQLCAEGKSIELAVKTATKIRLRPILMTTLAMIFGVLPLVFASGANSICRREIGIVVASGLFIGTFFSLVVVPILYTYLARFKQHKTR